MSRTIALSYHELATSQSPVQTDNQLEIGDILIVTGESTAEPKIGDRVIFRGYVSGWTSDPAVFVSKLDGSVFGDGIGTANEDGTIVALWLRHVQRDEFLTAVRRANEKVGP